MSKDDRYFKWPNWLKSVFRDRSPDLVIGDKESPYIRRWYILPRNRLFNIYLHQVLRDDDDRALHDHPWWNASVLLRGSYREMMPDFSAGETPHLRVADVPQLAKVRRRGSIVFRRPSAAHRLEVVKGPVWSLFITGPWRRHWGFHCKWGWRHWEEFTDPNDSGLIGRGCE